MADVWDDLPPLGKELISGILREGHKMLLAGPSKAAKSYLLIELCAAIAEGREWIGWQCAQGKVMYVNLELDRASCLHRFKDVYTSLKWEPNNLRNIDIWNLRGKSLPMDRLAPKLIRRAAKKGYKAIVIDPLYKIITGDENSADQMAQFCNQFDRLATELGAAVIYCHHHSKGQQGQKRSMDRASGSGVFARDPDVLLDLIELDLTDDLLKQEENKAVCAVCMKWLELHVKDWEEEVSQDDQCSERQMLLACDKLLGPELYKDMLTDVFAARQAVQQRTAWRIDGTLREFPKFKPVDLWFDYPTHQVDITGVLKDQDSEGDKPPWQRGIEKKKSNANKERRSKAQEFEDAVNACNMGEPPTVKDLIEWFSSSGKEVADRTIRDWIKKFGFEIDKTIGNRVVKKQT